MRRMGSTRPIIAAALFAALLLHNAEEALAYAHTRPAAEALIGRALPSPDAFRAALAGVSIAGGALLCWAAVGRDTPGRRRVLRLVAAVLFVNVFVPHVPAALLLGGYAPGVATALFINLPLSAFVWRRTAGPAHTGQSRIDADPGLTI
jgi:hypothetical protein